MDARNEHDLHVGRSHCPFVVPIYASTQAKNDGTHRHRMIIQKKKCVVAFHSSQYLTTPVPNNKNDAIEQNPFGLSREITRTPPEYVRKCLKQEVVFK